MTWLFLREREEVKVNVCSVYLLPCYTHSRNLRITLDEYDVRNPICHIGHIIIIHTHELKYIHSYGVYIYLCTLYIFIIILFCNLALTLISRKLNRRILLCSKTIHVYSSTLRPNHIKPVTSKKAFRQPMI